MPALWRSGVRCQDDDDISKGYLYMVTGWGILSGQANKKEGKKR